MRPIRIFLHLIQILSVLAIVFWGDQELFVWGLTLATLGVFAEILLYRGEVIATPMETLRSVEESKFLEDISRK